MYLWSVSSEYMKLLSIFYFPLLYYPLLLGSTLQLKTGYLFGALLSLTHGSVLLWQKIDCPKTPEVPLLSRNQSRTRPRQDQDFKRC